MLTLIDYNVIIAYADSGMNKAKAGRMLYMHPNTIGYHLSKVMEDTGKDPYYFYHLYDLVQMAVSELKKFTDKPLQTK